MFSRVELRQIRGHKETSIALDRFTVFVGPNGTGKSTVLGMIERTCAALRDALVPNSQGNEYQFREGYALDSLVRRGADELSCALLRSMTLEPIGRVAWTRAANGSWSDASTISGVAVATLSPRLKEPAAADALRALRGAFATLFLALDPPRIAQKGSLTASSDRVVGDGYYTAIALLKLAQRRDKNAFDAVVSGMRQIVDHLQNVRAVVTTGRESGVQLVYDFTDADDVSADCVSEGTLLATALLTALHGDDQPRVLLLDDIERGLHPSAQLRFVKQLKAMLEIQPELQIIATTHSPFILDALEPSQVRAFARRRDGSVAVKSLAEHPMAQENDGALTTGQLWSLDDEATWVLPEEERRP